MYTLNDVIIPDTAVCLAAKDLVKAEAKPFLLNHVYRAFAFGALAGKKAEVEMDEEAFFVSAILHDLGLIEKYTNESDRFEIVGADLAKEFLSRQGWSDKRIDVVWDAIALHTTTSIPQKKRPEIALVQTGAGIDIGAFPIDLIDPGVFEQILETWPRLNFKEAMIDALAQAAKRNPHASIFSFSADIAAREIPGFEVPHACDVITCSHFSE